MREEVVVVVVGGDDAGGGDDEGGGQGCVYLFKHDIYRVPSLACRRPALSTSPYSKPANAFASDSEWYTCN